MDTLHEELGKRYAELQEIPSSIHLLCAKISEDDEEDYRRLSGTESKLSVDEKRKRIQDAEYRTEVTYWNSLVFGFDRKTAGKWGDEFRNRLDTTLKHCADCVLNWHMKRKVYLQKFAE